MDLSYLIDRPERVLELTVEHLQLTLTALVIALVLAIPISLVATRFRFSTTPILGLLGVIYTIPSLAFLGLLVAPMGIGRNPALVALVLYAQIFLVRNIVAGLRGVNPALLEAARGLGMSSVQLFRQVWLPLALPIIIAGIRTALVTMVSLATVAAWINAGGLGSLLFEGLARQYTAMVFAGAVAIVTLALTIDLTMRLLERATAVSRANRIARHGR